MCWLEPLAAIVVALPEWLTAFPPGIRLFEVELLSADNGLAIAVEASRAPSATELEQMLASMKMFTTSSAQLWWKTSSQSKFVRLDTGGESLELALTDDVRLQVQPGQFVQVNGEINRQMIDQVLSLVRKTGTDKTASSKKGSWQWICFAAVEISPCHWQPILIE